MYQRGSGGLWFHVWSRKGPMRWGPMNATTIERKSLEGKQERVTSEENHKGHVL